MIHDKWQHCFILRVDENVIFVFLVYGLSVHNQLHF